MSDPDEPEEISAHDKYKPFQREVTIWLKDSELSLPEFAQFLRVEPAPLRETIAGKRIRPWLLERVRSLTGIDPPEDNRPYSGRVQQFKWFRSLVALMPKIEDRIRSKPTDREALLRDVGELAARAAAFEEWLESPMQPASEDDE